MTKAAGTTGTVNIATGTAGKAVNIGTDNTTSDTIAIGSALDSAKTRQMRYFAPDGQLFAKREELIAPIQAQVAAAIREVARRKKLDVVFDKGSNLAVVYANESLDITNEVLQQLGF